MEFEGFMYLDIENPLVAWNVYRGVLISQRLVQQNMGSAPVPSVSMTLANMLMNRSKERLKFEFFLETVRKQTSPASASRLNCLYVFDSAECALAAASNEAWGGHVENENLTDVGVSAAPNQTRVDANWITWMLKTQFESPTDLWQEGAIPYWHGVPCPHYDAPLWEVLLDGAITIWGTALRERAYKITKERSPRAVSLLEQARLAASLGSDLGHVSALVTTDKEKLVMSFHLDMRDADNPAYTDKLTAYIAANRHLVNHKDLAVGGDKFGVPNFVTYSYVFEANDFDI